MKRKPGWPRRPSTNKSAAQAHRKSLTARWTQSLLLQVTANVASMAEMCAELKGVKYAKEILKDLQHHVGLMKADSAQLLEAFKGGGQGGAVSAVALLLAGH